MFKTIFHQSGFASKFQQHLFPTTKKNYPLWGDVRWSHSPRLTFAMNWVLMVFQPMHQIWRFLVLKLFTWDLLPENPAEKDSLILWILGAFVFSVTSWKKTRLYEMIEILTCVSTIPSGSLDVHQQYNSSRLKMNGWNMIFPFGFRHIFRGKVLPLPETNSKTLKIDHSKRKFHLPTIHFQVRSCC